MEVMELMLGEFVDEYTVRVVDVFAMSQSGTGVSVEAVDHIFQTNMLDMLKQTAKLGETNKFYYDDKLKRWVEEGVDPPAEEATLPPPPTTGAFPNRTDYNLNSALKSEGSLSSGSPPSPAHSAGIPPIPRTSNQFSARGRMGVRSSFVQDSSICTILSLHMHTMMSNLEWTSEHCSAPFQAPELWDVPSHADIDERTDIWSLGCTLYAIMQVNTSIRDGSVN